MATQKRQAQKAEVLNEVVIAEIREIFTLFDKNADGYVSTNELGTIVRGLNFNPTEREVAEMQKDVDPQQTGSFDQNSLISLIARRPKQTDTLEDMIESLKILSQDTQAAADESNKNKALTLQVDNFKNQMTTQGKENGENLLDHYVEEIITDSKLVHEDCIIIDDFAKYLMSK